MNKYMIKNTEGIEALKECEEIIQSEGKRVGEGILRIARAINRIKTEKLYKEAGHKNMETYTKECLGWGRTMMRGFITISILAKDKTVQIDNKGFVELLAIATEKKRQEKGKDNISTLSKEEGQAEKKDNISTLLTPMWTGLGRSKAGIEGARAVINKLKEEGREVGADDLLKLVAELEELDNNVKGLLSILRPTEPEPVKRKPGRRKKVLSEEAEEKSQERAYGDGDTETE